MKRLLFAAALVGLIGGNASAAVKSYDSSVNNGATGDTRRISINLCPPLASTPGTALGAQVVTDDGLGTVTLNQVEYNSTVGTDLSGGILIPIFGPGAFIFIEGEVDRGAGSAVTTSTTTGIGGHGPSSTAPGASAEWGAVSGWLGTGFTFCISSPVTICNQNGFAHGQTAPFILPSTSYDLGTWEFDAEGDMQATSWYMSRTSNGGLSNNQTLLRGAFVGSALPALPMVGFGILALSLAVVGGRSLMGKK